MLYFRVGSLPEVRQLPTEARTELLRKHIGLRFYFTMIGKAGIMGALVYAVIRFGLPQVMSEKPAWLMWAALGAGVLVGVVRYFMLMAGFRRQLQEAMGQT